MNVARFIADSVALGVRGAGSGNLPGVVVGDVGSNATKGRG